MKVLKISNYSNLKLSPCPSKTIFFVINFEFPSPKAGLLEPLGIQYCQPDPTTTTTTTTTTTGITAPPSTLNCIQDALNNVCATIDKPECSGYSFARYNTIKGKWRCYESASTTNNIKSCVNEIGDRTPCEGK